MSHRVLFGVAAILLGSLSPARAATVAECAIGVSGVDVEVGRTSLMQCMRYARASMIDKSDVQNRLVRHGETRYRVGRKDAEISTDGGASWQPMLEEAAPETKVAAPSAAAPAPFVTPDRRAAAQTPPTAGTTPAPVAAEKPAISPATPTASIRAPVVAPAAAPQSAAANPPAEARRALAVALYPCQYDIGGQWHERLAKSLEDCVGTIKALPPSGSDAHGYWQGFYIALNKGQVYVSEDGKQWRLADAP